MKAKTFCAKKVSERNRKGYWLKAICVLNKSKVLSQGNAETAQKVCKQLHV